MPVGPIVGAAIASGVASLGGAALGARAQGKATQAQQRAADQAMALERERERAKAQRYEAAMEDYRKQYDAWDAMRRAAFAQQGINLPEPAKRGADVSGYGGGRGGPVQRLGVPLGALATAGTTPAAGPAGLYDSQGGPVSSMAPPTAGPEQGLTLADMAGMSNWSDWRKNAPPV